MSMNRASGKKKKIPFEKKVFDLICRDYPECIAPDFKINTDFVRLILNTTNRLIIEEEPSMEFEYSEYELTEEAERITGMIPKQLAKQPLTCRVVRLIHEAYNTLAYEKFCISTADVHCTCAWEFNNRANVRAGLGRYLEAHRDYNRACELDPKEPVFFLNRANFRVSLGIIDDAVKDCMHVLSLIDSGDAGNDADLFELANIFLACGETLLSAQALLNCVRLKRSLVPYTIINDDDIFIIINNGQPLQGALFAGAYGLRDITKLAKKIYKKAYGEKNSTLIKLIRELQKEVYKLKKELDELRFQKMSQSKKRLLLQQ